MDELRCESCSKLLMKARLTPPSTIEILCRRCSHLNLIFVEDKGTLGKLVPDGQGGYLTEVEA